MDWGSHSTVPRNTPGNRQPSRPAYLRASATTFPYCNPHGNVFTVQTYTDVTFDAYNVSCVQVQSLNLQDAKKRGNKSGIREKPIMSKQPEK